MASSSSSSPPPSSSYIVLSADHVSNDCTSPNYESGFQTPPADSSTHRSPPPSPKLLEQLKINPVPEATLHGRDAPPSHFLLKIKSFNLLSKASIKVYESEEFEAGGYKWKTLIYPTGDEANDGRDHVSLYLELVETSSLPTGWEVVTMFNFFVFDQLRDKYVGLRDVVVRRFHSMKTLWGVAKFIDLETFNDPSKGYLVGGECTFGAEVFVVKNTFEGQCLSLINDPATCSHTWKVDEFSLITSKRIRSDSFIGGRYSWYLILFPKGIVEGRENNISLVLELDVSTLPPSTKLFVHCILRVKDQITCNHHEIKGNNMFSASFQFWGFQRFLSHSEFKAPSKGFLVNDTCIFEAEFRVLGLLKTSE